MKLYLKLAAGLAVCAVVCHLYAQNPSATLVGSVTDPSGSAVAGARVKVRDSANNQVRKTESDAKGSFIVPNLAPGTYDVEISKDGFRSLRQTDLELQLDQQARIDFHLEVGAVSQTIEVMASVPLINTENAVKGDVVVRQELLEMPLNGRDFTDLAMLTAGVLPNYQGNSGSTMAINGARADNTNFLVDGFNNQSPRDANPQARPNLDAMQEFKIQTSAYSAELGRLAGGVMNVALKSGSNRLHGALFEFLRNDHLDARNFFNTTKSELRRNQFGATLDGPVFLPKIYDGRNRTFFLFSWESYRQRQGSPSLQVVPTANDRLGNFAGRGLIKDPLATGACTAATAAACFPNNQIPASRMSPAALKIQQFYPLQNLNGVNNYYADPKAMSEWNSYVVKLDQHITAADTLSIRYLLRQNNGNGPFAGSIPTFLAATSGNQTLAGLTYTRIFSSALINELRIGATRRTYGGTGGHQDQDYNALFGLPSPSDRSNVGFPAVQITNYSFLGDAANEPMKAVVNTFTFGDTLTWVKGAHVFKGGGEIMRYQWNNLFLNNVRGTFAFTGAWTGQPYADFLLGYLNSSTRLDGTLQSYTRNTSNSAFFQDDWKITPRLTLNLGMRYELPKPVYEKNGRWGNYIPDIRKYIYAADPATARAGISFTDPTKLSTAKEQGLPQSLVYTNYKDLAPRIGLAWRPFGDNRTSLRGGYGMFYGSGLLNNVLAYLGQAFPYIINQTNNRNAANPNVLTLATPFPTPASLTSNISTIALGGWELHAPTPYLQSWNLTMEREIGLQSAVEVSYTGSKGTHLSRVYNINQPYRSAATSPNFPVPYPGWSTINYIGFGFDSTYNSGSITLRRRFARGFFYRVSYVYSKSIDDASQMGVSNATSAAGTGGMQDPRNFSLERGRSDWDVGHAFTMAYSWEMPWRNNFLVRGWQLAGTGILRTGQPLTVMVNNINANLGEAVRPNRIAKGTVSDPGPNRWFDVSAFPVVPTGSYNFGTAGRDILDGPGAIQVNLSLFRNIKIRERSALQFRWEVFNALNHANFNQPVYFVNTPNAATVTSAGDSRLMQFGLRLSF